MHMRKALSLLVAAGLVLSAGGCSSPREGGQLNVAVVGNPGCLNPVLAADSAAEAISGYIYQGLVTFNDKMEAVGQLARDWEVSADNLQWTFHLRRDVTWHDGQPFTAADVEFTYTTLAFAPDFPGPRAAGLDMLERVEAVDEYTVRFTLSAPWGGLLGLVAQGVLPKHVFAGASGEDLAGHPANWQPVGTGPFVFAEWADNRYVTLTRNENYYGGKPYLDALNFKFYPDAEGAVAALERGEVDVVTAVSHTHATRLQEKVGETHAFYAVQDMGYECLCFNVRPGAFGSDKTNPWLDHRVRKAVAFALDRERYVQELLDGWGVLMNSPFPPASWAYSAQDVTVYNYNPQTAASLLNEAGWRPGSDGLRRKWGQILAFTLTVRSDNPLEKALAELVQENLARLGIRVDLQPVTLSDMLLNHIYTGKFHMLLMGLSVGADPDIFDAFHSEGLNLSGYNNPQLDRALLLARQAGQRGTRQELYGDVQGVLTRDLPYVFLFSRQLVTVAPKDLGGFEVTPLGLSHPERWHFKEKK